MCFSLFFVKNDVFSFFSSFGPIASGQVRGGGPGRSGEVRGGVPGRSGEVRGGGPGRSGEVRGGPGKSKKVQTTQNCRKYKNL